MQVLIVGAGAVGGTFGAKLSRSDHSVGFVARGENGRAIREHGLVLEAPDGFITARGEVFESVEAARDFGAELALISVKWRGLDEVAAATGDALAPGGVAIPLLNGLDAEQRLAAAIGEERVIGGVAQLSASLLGPGRVLLRAGGMLTLAPFVAGQETRVAELATLLSPSFPCQVEPDLAKLRWQKLLWNAPFNAVCALTRRSAGQVLALPALESVVRQVMAEVISVAESEGVEIGDGAIEAMLAITRGLFADSEPSMLQDVLAGRETEADQLQGAVVLRARRHGVHVPLLELLHALLLGLGQEGRPS
jgi:2-dehydropantoate 2-reductase